MTSLTIRNLDDDLMTLLRLRARQHGRSMADEASSILRSALVSPREDCSGAALYAAIRWTIEPWGGVELTPFDREPQRDPPDFGGSEVGK